MTTRTDIDISDTKGMNGRLNKFCQCKDALSHDSVLTRLLKEDVGSVRKGHEAERCHAKISIYDHEG